MKGEQAGEEQERVAKLGPDGAHEATSQMEGIRLVRRASRRTHSVPLPPVSKIRRESHGDLGGQPTPGTFCELSGNYCGITVGDLNKPPHPSYPLPHFFYCGTSRERAGQLGNKDPILGICSLQPYPLHSQLLNVCPKETLPAHCAATRAGAAPWHPVGKGESVTHPLKLK